MNSKHDPKHFKIINRPDFSLVSTGVLTKVSYMMCCSEQDTNREELNVVVDEIFHNTGLLRCMSSGLEEAGRENACQTLSFHLVYVRAALNPGENTSTIYSTHK